MKNYVVSIIVPIYNAEKYLNKCIESIVNQLYSNIEIILIDDGSTDNSLNICKDYCMKDKRIRLISQKNGGPSKARNNGIKNSSGDYILFVDSDDYIENNMIKEMIDSMNNESYDIVICSYNKSIDDELISVELEEKNSFEEYLFESSTMGFSMCKMIKKECITNYFNNNLFYMEDMCFWVSNMKNINIIQVVNKCLYNYRIVNSSSLHRVNYDYRKESIFEACNLLIELVPIKYKKIYKKIYIDYYYLYNEFLDIRHKKYYLKYYNEILKDNTVSLLTKIKIFIKNIIIRSHFRLMK